MKLNEGGGTLQEIFSIPDDRNEILMRAISDLFAQLDRKELNNGSLMAEAMWLGKNLAEERYVAVCVGLVIQSRLIQAEFDRRLSKVVEKVGEIQDKISVLHKPIDKAQLN